jgi:diaminohydroxyphosphoribosylaminopyrimidine deaminase/5-amino-6-(5-phosphoribosylamino)uracil reductase
MMWNSADYQYMSLALQLAQQGLYSTSPNPRVGCVIVQHGQVIGRGAHLKAGQPHAEIIALQDAQQHYPDSIKGATVYISLEPCSHHGRTPPCADALIAAGVGQVIAAMQDPNPQVAGQGLARLAQAGIPTSVGLLASTAEQLNIGFVQRMRLQRPWVRVKIAASLDGKTALHNGHSAWISNAHSRLDVQHWRAQSCAILTGIGTMQQDNPRLNVREIATARQPLKVILDSHLNISPQAEILKSGDSLLVTAQDLADAAMQEKIHTIQTQAKKSQASVNFIALANQQAQVDLSAVMQHLAKIGINELLVEAGPTLNGALLQAGLVDELIIYLAPHLLGGQAQQMLQQPVLDNMQGRVQLEWKDVRQFGDDIRLIARPILEDAD